MSRLAIKHKYVTSCFFSILITAWFLAGNVCSLSISRFNIYIDGKYVVTAIFFISTALGFVLMCFVPKNKMSAYELFLNAVLPLSLAYALYLVDYSLIPVILFLVFSTAAIVFVIFLQKKKRVKRTRTVFLSRHIIAICALVFLIPAYICFKYGNDTVYEYLAEPDEVVSLSMDEVNEQELKERISNCAWDDLNAQERSDIIFEVLEHEANLLGIELPDIKIDTKMYDTLKGSYSHETNIITLNLYRIGTGDMQDVLHTAFHELYHAYEYAVIGIINDMPNNGWNENMYFKQAISWKEASDNYSDDYENYYTYQDNQLEVDANLYAEETVKKYIK